MTSNRTALLGWLLPGAAAIAVAAGLLAWQWPNISGHATRAARTRTATGTLQQDPVARGGPQPFAAGQQAGLAASADHVRVTAFRRGDMLVAHLVIDAGWHINANPASLDFLIPTQLSVRNQDSTLSTSVDYPSGHTVDVGLAQPITVYSDNVRITAALPDSTPPAPLQAALRVQACSNKGRCLMPSTVTVPVLSSSET